MAEPTWLGYGGLAASTLSAIAAYLAIRQSIVQRKITNKVQLITKNTSFKITGVKSRNSIKIDRFSDTFKQDISIINVGPGPAINIEYQWIFDYENALIKSGIIKSNKENPNKNLDELNAGNYIFRYTDIGVKYVEIIRQGEPTWVFQDGKYKDVDYILPWSVHKEEVSFRIPNLMMILLIRECLGDGNDTIDMFQIIKGPMLIVKYEDITGSKSTNVFTSKFRNTNVRIGDDGYEVEFTIFLEPFRSKTAVVLERVRRWYANLF